MCLLCFSISLSRNLSISDLFNVPVDLAFSVCSLRPSRYPIFLTHLCIYPSTHCIYPLYLSQSIYPSVYHLLVSCHLPRFLSILLATYKSIHLANYPANYLPTSVSIFPSISVSIYLPTNRSTYLYLPMYFIYISMSFLSTTILSIYLLPDLTICYLEFSGI